MKHKKETLIIIIAVAYLILCILFAGFSMRHSILSAVNSFFPPDEVTPLNLSAEEKMEDFTFLYDTVLSSMPMIEEYKGRYGFGFSERKEYYAGLVRATKSDYEFFCVMNAILEDVPSFHTDLVYPDAFQSLYCYNSRSVSSNRTTISKNNYWLQLADQQYQNDANLAYHCFTYVDGGYWLNTYRSTVPNPCKMRLLSVDGVPVDQYIIEHVSVFGLLYDGKHEKPFRNHVVFNDSIGVPVVIEYLDAQGNRNTKTVYDDLVQTTSFLFSKPLDELEDFYIHETHEVSYVQINNLSMGMKHGERLTTALNNLNSPTVILDLRENYGGHPDFVSRYIYPALFNRDVSTENYWYTTNSDANKLIDSPWYNKVTLRFKKAEDSPYQNPFGLSYRKSLVKRKYTGASKQNHQVIALISQRTGSAADRFAAIIKDEKLGTLVGNNTGGEGLANSYMTLALPNSRLVFIYMPGGALNSDGTDNSVYGTSPDIYIVQTVDDFYRKMEMLSKEMKISTFEERLNYDTVLNDCLNHLIDGVEKEGE